MPNFETPSDEVSQIEEFVKNNQNTKQKVGSFFWIALNNPRGKKAIT